MQKQLEELEAKINKEIYKRFLEKFHDNKSAFARAAYCRESTIRRIFKNEQSITIPLLLRICTALDVKPSELLNGIEFIDENRK
jgi:plasmid maintenance system antidote protein VapI